MHEIKWCRLIRIFSCARKWAETLSDFKSRSVETLSFFGLLWFCCIASFSRFSSETEVLTSSVRTGCCNSKFNVLSVISAVQECSAFCHRHPPAANCRWKVVIFMESTAYSSQRVIQHCCSSVFFLSVESWTLARVWQVLSFLHVTLRSSGTSHTLTYSSIPSR